MMSENILSQKDKYGDSPYTRYLEQTKSQRPKVDWWLPGADGSEEWEVV